MRTHRVSPLAPILGALLFVLLSRAVLFDVRMVRGSSMFPTLVSGQLVIVNRAAYGLRVPILQRYALLWRMPHENELIVVKSPIENRFLIKRCTAATDSMLYILGDNPDQSVDSRLFGMVSVHRVAGRAIPLGIVFQRRNDG